MGTQFSKKTRDVSDETAQSSTQIDPKNPQITPDLSSYEAACRVDPDLQSFDSTLQERTSRVIKTLAAGVEVRSLSLDSLREVTECLADTNQEVVKAILECKQDIWNNKDLFDLVEDYYDSSLHTLDFCTALEKCLKRTRDTQLIIQVALQQFDKEQRNGDYSRTLQELKNFKSIGNPFTEEFFTLFESVYNQQVLMLQKLQINKCKLDKKLKSLKSWRRVSNIIFVATFASVLIFSVVAAAVAAPPVVTALAAAAAVPLGSMGKWFDSLWNKYENEVRGQRDIINSIHVGTYIAIKDMDSIRVVVERLEIQIESLLQDSDFALTEEDSMILAVDEIKKKLSGFVKTIEDLGENADKFSRDITRARTVISHRIIKHSSD